MSRSTTEKSDMRFPFRFSDMRIRTKLLAVTALIISVFLMIVLAVILSFHRIENVLGGVIRNDMNNVMTNALTERELSSIVADLNLLLGTFFEDEAHLDSEGERLIQVTRVLARRIKGSDLEAPLGLSVRRMEFLVEQCRLVNADLRLVRAAERHMVSGFDRLDEIISGKLINAVLIGDDTTILQQLSVLVVGYRQSLLEIGKLHAERWPETYYAPLDQDGDPLIAAIDELDLRLRPLIAGDPQIADLGRAVIRDLQTYKNGLLALNAVMIELKKRMLDVESAGIQAKAILKKLDRDVVQAVNAANTKVLQTFRVTQASLMGISLALIASLIVLTTFFFKSIIKKPMDDIRDGIKAFRRGNLTARIDLNRRDEWCLIEDALNVMAADLSTSYADLKTAQRLVSNIIDSMPSVLVGVNSKGMVTQWNSRAEQVTGIPSEKAYSQPLEKVFPVLTREMDRMKTAIRERRVLRDSKVLREGREGACRYEDITIFPLVANGVEGAVIRVDDVTEQVRLEEMMIQSEKMLSAGGLAAGMAHEINNPLAGMIQSADVMKSRLMDLNMPANLKAAREVSVSIEQIRAFMDKRSIFRMINTINESGLRVAEIVDNMLSFARKSDDAFSPHHPAHLMERIIELAATDYDLKKEYDFKTIKIVKEYEEDLPMLPCERTKIQQVLLNIFRNGAQAMQSRGMENQAHPCFIVRLAKEDKMLRIEIEDNGPGMDQTIQSKIFEPFFTTKPVGVGTGLGLSVSYFIITQNHGGTMDVVSSPGKGSNFIIRLPLETEENNA
ncbi:ATP-binding protein [Desulfospira joergensenii]|uniref:ATP-binding protein n=1 Tax=Desulfospira joergensenii TaxID=53329 RepID=UPI0003B5BCD5|nr:ATP-binding protein [Desulfospira joergensenii]